MRSLLALTLAAGLAAAACGAMDEAQLIDPGTTAIEADPGELRVLRHHDDPTAGDRWLPVLEPDADVVVATERFRESGSRHATEDEPADVRLLYEAVGEGRTLLVQLNCRSCDGGVPETDPDATELLVWDFVVGDAAEQEPSLGPAAAAADGVHTAGLGEHVVIVRPPGAEHGISSFDGAVLRLVARHEPDDGADLLVDVFAAVGPGETTLTYGSDQYAVRVA